MRKRTKLTLVGLSVFVLYSIVSLFQGLPLKLLNITNISDNFAIMYSLIISILLTTTIAVIFKDRLKNDFVDMKKNHNTYFKKYFKYWLFALVCMSLSNLIIISISENVMPNNEELIKELFKINPILVFTSAVLIAPILEELVFRLSFRYMFNDSLVFIFLSSLTFGAFHVLGTVTSWYDLLYIIPYSIPGIFFAITLEKSKNVFVPISLHFIHNGILMSLQFLILILG